MRLRYSCKLFFLYEFILIDLRNINNTKSVRKSSKVHIWSDLFALINSIKIKITNYAKWVNELTNNKEGADSCCTPTFDSRRWQVKSKGVAI